jgi:Na+-driven multidrug efflux pump
LIAQGAWLLQIKILATFGSAALAGYTIAMRIALFAALPILGIANAGATLVGQNLGAHRPDRAEAAVHFTVRSSTMLMAFTGAVTALLCQQLIHLLTTDPDVVAQATTALRIVSVALPLYAAGACLGAAFNGAGDVRTPTRLSFICSWLGQLPLAWVLAHLVGLDATGVFLAVPISFAALTLWLGILFRRGSWKLVQL